MVLRDGKALRKVGKIGLEAQPGRQQDRLSIQGYAIRSEAAIVLDSYFELAVGRSDFYIFCHHTEGQQKKSG